jgi:serine/threonine protein phosphatase 1
MLEFWSEFIMKYFVVSDVHDHYNLLLDALDDNGFDVNNKNHRLILCGDAFYSGPQPGELFVFLRNLKQKDRLIFIRGNHDVELYENLINGKFNRPANRKCAELVVKHLTEKTGLSDEELVEECSKIGFTDFIHDASVWYFETKNYIFTHGFIPTTKREYYPNWRNATEKEWKNASARGDAMLLSMFYKISEPHKKIVCGHYSAARCYLMKNATQSDWENKIYKDVSKVPKEGFKPFFADTFIAIDQSVKKTGFINCIVIDEEKNDIKR